MKKSVMYLINGLGVEKAGSYNIVLEECMPSLFRINETAYFTTAITASLDEKTAYQRFYLGDTYKSEVEFLKSFIAGGGLNNNPSFMGLKNAASNPDTKLHIFLEPTNEKVANEINALYDTLELPPEKKVYLHLLLPQVTVDDYPGINNIVNYIKYHMNQKITVGFVMGKNFFPEDLKKDMLDYAKKMFFYSSCERWTETETKFKNLQVSQTVPCNVAGFCTLNDCIISNGDTIFFFNTRRNNYDNIIKAIYQNAGSALGEGYKLETFSLIKLFSKFNIPSFVDNVDYDGSLANILLRNNKKCLIIADQDKINSINFYANGLNNINNPVIGFMQKTDDLYDPNYLTQVVDTSPYDLIIFDYSLNVSGTVNDLKDDLTKQDTIINYLGQICANKHSLFITSLYGLKATLPVADYNQEMVTIDYENQIPIFFNDYDYPHNKYLLFPGDTNDILSSAIKCITGDPKLDTLIREKTFIGSLLKSFIK